MVKRVQLPPFNKGTEQPIRHTCLITTLPSLDSTLPTTNW
jgi:hypothetical protein